MPLNISDNVYMKIACHAAKHAYRDVYGLLVEDENGVSDAVPLSHMAINSCFLHSALDVALRTLAKTPGLKICGFYDFEESFPNDEPSFQMQKTILASLQTISKLKKTYYVRAQAVKVNRTPENLQEMTIPEALAEFEKNDYRLQFSFYSFDTSALMKLPESEIKGSFNLQVFERLFKDGVHLNTMDMDEHFDDPANDFMNCSLLN